MKSGEIGKELIAICRKFIRGGERERNEREKRKKNGLRIKLKGRTTQGGNFDYGQDEANGGDERESAIKRGVGEVKRTVRVYCSAAVLLKSKSLSTGNVA